VRILIASTYVPFIRGGGTGIVEDLLGELTARGHQTDAVMIPLYSDWRALPEQTAALRLLDLTESSGNHVDRLITVRYPSYALRHPNKVAWFIHHHREAYDLWGTKWSSMPDNDHGRHHRDLLRRSDDLYLRECRKVFTNSRVVADRLRRFNQLEPAGVLYPPLPAARRRLLRPGPFGDYLVYLSRVNPIKRQALAVEALRFADPAVKLVIAGTADEPTYDTSFRQLVADSGFADRVRLTGWISEEEKADLLAGCCGALFLAHDEDSYGYATLEAFHAHKPVITLSDSGGSLEVIRDGENGLVRSPTADALGEAMTRLWRDRAAGERMGAEAHATIARAGIHWDAVIRGLLS
jgi:glycosyltransferase involved in cell wall biosynthesis